MLVLSGWQNPFTCALFDVALPCNFFVHQILVLSIDLIFPVAKASFLALLITSANCGLGSASARFCAHTPWFPRTPWRRFLLSTAKASLIVRTHFVEQSIVFVDTKTTEPAKAIKTDLIDVWSSSTRQFSLEREKETFVSFWLAVFCLY